MPDDGRTYLPHFGKKIGRTNIFIVQLLCNFSMSLPGSIQAFTFPNYFLTEVIIINILIFKLGKLFVFLIVFAWYCFYSFLYPNLYEPRQQQPFR